MYKTTPRPHITYREMLLPRQDGTGFPYSLQDRIVKRKGDKKRSLQKLKKERTKRGFQKG